MSETTYLIAGLAAGALAGGAIAWLMARSRFGSRSASLEATLSEVRSQLTGKNEESAALRQELDSRRSAQAEAAARLEEAQLSLERQRETV